MHYRMFRSRFAAAALGLATALALSGCSGKDERDTASDDVSTLPTFDSAPDASEAPLAEPGTEAPTTPDTATDGTTPAKIIPSAVRGRWGLVPADCTSTKGDAKGLLVIDSNSLKFYESVGRLTSVAETSDTQMRGSFDFSGEGMNWQRDVVLDAQDGGKTLIRREYGKEAEPGPFKYTRC